MLAAVPRSAPPGIVRELRRSCVICARMKSKAKQYRKVHDVEQVTECDHPICSWKGGEELDHRRRVNEMSNYGLYLPYHLYPLMAICRDHANRI